MDETIDVTQSTQADNSNDMGNDTGTQGAKSFTQDEVNNIIQTRLDKLKKQAASEQEMKYAQKVKELEARESMLLLKESLAVRKMPAELAEVITCTDEKDMNSKLDVLQKLIEGEVKKAIDNISRPGQTRYNPVGGKDVVHDNIRESMGL